jgi:hypothetical protein
MTLDIKQDSKIAHAEAVRGLGLVQAFDVSLQSVLQAFNFAQNLCAFTSGQPVEVIQGASAVFDFVAKAVHFRKQPAYGVKPQFQYS